MVESAEGYSEIVARAQAHRARLGKHQMVRFRAGLVTDETRILSHPC
jgi:hypothetical protein